MERINKFKFVLWIILGAALAVGITRFIYGLGATTNLTDNTPWGFWIGFDVMGGVALAAGGFVIAAFNYIFGKKEFKPIARAAILTAFLGYVAVVVGLLFDLGLPWNIWHLIIFWNPHSPLFEVGWCVMLYLTVLFLEFAPVVLEKYPNLKLVSKIHNFLDKIKIPLVIAGIALSTLHQSSLGSLFLAMPYRLHPLWYSPVIPVIFFVSAIMLGLMMVMVESMTSSYLYKQKPEYNILKKLRKYAMFAIGFYAIFRFADILIRGAGTFLVASDWGTFIFWIEIAVTVAIPMLLFALYKGRNISVLYFGALIGVIGVVFNRLNVGGLTHLNNLTQIGSFYFPSWMELLISAGVVSLAMLAFFYFVENYRVWEEPPKDPEADPKKKPGIDQFKPYLGPTAHRNRIKFSLSFVLAFAVAFAAISSSEIKSEGIEPILVDKSRGGDTLLIDGNKNGYTVEFTHQAHIDRGRECVECHHMNTPKDENTECYECHSYMFKEGDAFGHDWHASEAGADIKCFECHDEDASKGKKFRENPELITELCFECHDDLIPKGSEVQDIKTYKTMSYTDALHNSCIDCHNKFLEKDSALRVRKPNLAKCSNCHYDYVEYVKKERLFQEKRDRNKWVVVPGDFIFK